MIHAPTASRLDVADRLGLAAVITAGVVAALGLAVLDLYRDRPVLVDATRADNLVQLAFALPLGLVAAAFLARRDPRGTMLTLGFVWFSGLLALDMFVEQLWFGATGGVLDLSQAFPFGLIFLLSALVVAPTLIRRSHAPATLPVAA